MMENGTVASHEVPVEKYAQNGDDDEVALMTVNCIIFGQRIIM